MEGSHMGFKGIFLGFRAPFRGVLFLIQRPLLLLMALLPWAVGAGLFLGIGLKTVDPYLAHKFSEFRLGDTAFPHALGVVFRILILSFLFPLVWLPIWKIVVSPWMDALAQKAWEIDSGRTLPDLSWRFAFVSIRVEIKKVLFTLGVQVILGILSLFFPPLGVLCLIFGFWSLGWQELDRCLALTTLSFRQRLLFAVRQTLPLICFGALSSWPLVGLFFMWANPVGGSLLLWDLRADWPEPMRQALAPTPVAPALASEPTGTTAL